MAKREAAFSASREAEFQILAKDLDAEAGSLKDMLGEAMRKAEATQEDAKANFASAAALRLATRKGLGDVILMVEDKGGY